MAKKNTRIVEGPGIKKTNTPRIRKHKVRTNQHSFKVKGRTRESIVSQVSNRIGTQEKNIKDDLLKYLNDIFLVGQTENDLCLYDVCCNGSNSGGKWYIECKR